MFLPNKNGKNHPPNSSEITNIASLASRQDTSKKDTSQNRKSNTKSQKNVVFSLLSCRFRAGACTNMSIPSCKKQFFLKSGPTKNAGFWPKNRPSLPPGKPVPYSCLCHPHDHAPSTFGVSTLRASYGECQMPGQIRVLWN